MHPNLPGFERCTHTYLNARKTVYIAGSGPAVVVIHEVPSITPQVLAFAQKVVDAGFRVYMPSLIGTPGQAMTTARVAQSFAKLCISREFSVLSSNQSSPVVDWLRELAKHAHAECGGPGVGVVGMCFSGNFGLGMMLGSPVIAPVLSQPSLPFGPLPSMMSALHISDTEKQAVHDKINTQNAKILGLRFEGDFFCTKKRFDALREEFGAAFEGIEIAAEHARKGTGTPPHSVLTTHLIDETGQPTREALDRTLAFLTTQLKP